jgi:hypothetical protein
MGGKWQTSAVDVGRSSFAPWTFVLLRLQTLDMFAISCPALLGFASGFSSVLVPIYLGELAPPTLRGFLRNAVCNGHWHIDCRLVAFPFAEEEVAAHVCP